MLIVNGRQASIDLGDNEGPFRFARGSTSEPTHPASGLRERALVQMDRSDRLSWYAELAEVDNERAEGRGGAVQRPPLRSGDRHPVRALVSSIQAEFARPGGNDGRARPVDGAYDHHALGATLVSPRAGLAANSGAPGRDLASAPRMEKFLKLRSQDD